MLVDFALVGQRERRLSTEDTIHGACLLRLGYWLERRLERFPSDRTPTHSVIAGLDPAIHERRHVDPRVKPRMTVRR
jgi:hypothetical protein